MQENDTPSPAQPASAALPAWLQPGWDGPAVELRPADADASWPEGAHHRVRFDRERYAGEFYPHVVAQLPHTAFFREDGWPLEFPGDVLPKLEPRFLEELHRDPWVVNVRGFAPQTLVELFSDWDKFWWGRFEGGFTRAIRRVVHATAHTG